MQVNDIFYNKLTNSEFRILYCDKSKNIAVVIGIDDSVTLPKEMAYNNIEAELESGVLEQHETWIASCDFDSLTEKQKESVEKIWQAILPLVMDPSKAFDKRSRAAFLSETVEKTGVSRVGVQTWLHKFWVGGGVKAAIVPQYEKRGNRGERNNSSGVKLGRPIEYQTENQGLNIGEKEKKQIESVIRQYYNKNEKFTMKYCYQQLINTFYRDKKSGEYAKAFPTMDQFRYHAKQFLNMRKRIGEKKFDRNYRSLHGSSATEAEGPGEKYQIDATVADIYLVSKWSRNVVVGRPILYFVTDVFSRMITGFYISLEGPSWIDAMMAVYYAIMDKTEFCRKYGIEISPEEWPCKGIPQQLLTDNGELVSRKSEVLIEGLGIHLQNATAWRPDMKGIVEQQFHMLNTSTKMILPGAVQPDWAERGAHDYKQDALLNLREFYQLVIRYVLKHNSRTLSEHPQLAEDTVRDGIPAVPIRLWEWGIINRSGSLRTISSQEAAYSLLPTEQATVTQAGIRFNGRLYSCDSFIKEGWGSAAALGKSWRIDIKHDPRTPETILHCSESGYEPCNLIDNRFQDWMEEDFFLQEKWQKTEKKKGQEQDTQREIDFQNFTEELIANARKEKDAELAQNNVVAFPNVKGKQIRENRRTEAEAQREEERFLGKKKAAPKKKPQAPQPKAKRSRQSAEILKLMSEEESDE